MINATMNSKNSSLATSIKNLFLNEKLSDFTIDIIEMDETFAEPIFSMQSRKRKNLKRDEKSFINKESLFCSLPVHSQILSAQSSYFEKQFEWANKDSLKKIRVKAKKDEGYFFQLFIRCLYDPQILADAAVIELVQIIKIADRCLCDGIIEEATDALNSAHFKDFKECLAVVNILSHMRVIESLKVISDQILLKSSQYACMFFSPLEEKFDAIREDFKNIPLILLHAMLQCREPLAFYENSVLFFVLFWFENNISEQTANNIELVLLEMNCRELTKDYLLDIITEENPILCKYSRYCKWFVSIVTDFKKPCSLTKTWELNHSRSLKKEDRVPIFQVHFKKMEDNLFVANRTIIHNGYQFRMTINVSSNENCKDLLIEFDCINFNQKKYDVEEDKSFVLAKLEVAIAIQYGNFNKVNVLPDFKNVHSRCLVCQQFSLISRSASAIIFLGSVRNNYYDRFNEFDLYIAFRNHDVKWPKFYPPKVRRSSLFEEEFIIVDENTIATC